MSVPSPSDPDALTDLKLFSGQLSLSAGRFPATTGKRIAGPMRRGLKIAILLDGRQSLELDDRPAVMIDGPALLVAANSGDHLQQRTSLSGGTIRCVLMQFDLDFVEREFAAPMKKLFALVGAEGAGVWVRPADARLRSLALQIAEQPVAEPLRQLYLAGKALELAAVALNEIVGKAPLRPARLPTRTREQVLAARDMLVAAMQEPPSLAELARITGLNPTKLTSAFRAEFGTSVFAYLQEQRLQQAHAMIAGGHASVAEAAFRVGYTPAHFSGLFRKRFGLSPSALR
ncbi:helix-turn-helix transcriptional regulator [Bosea sp. NPDC055332]